MLVTLKGKGKAQYQIWKREIKLWSLQAVGLKKTEANNVIVVITTLHGKLLW